MVRVPNTQSLSIFLGDALDPGIEPELAYAELSPGEVDQLIVKCRRTLARCRRDCLHRDPLIAEEAMSTVEAVQNILIELLQSAPEGKRAKIEALLHKSVRD